MKNPQAHLQRHAMTRYSYIASHFKLGNMIKSGGYFLFKGTRYVISAVLSIKGRLYIAAVAHVFHGAGGGEPCAC